eukprot:20504-Pelagomonas_calceolata.AAC.1
MGAARGSAGRPAPEEAGPGSCQEGAEVWIHWVCGCAHASACVTLLCLFGIKLQHSWASSSVVGAGAGGVKECQIS